MNNKLISFAAAAATLFAFAACNKDANQIDVVTPGTGTYAKVSISMGTPGTRATAGVGDDEFDAGTPNEAKVNSVMLVLYGDEGKVVGYGSTEKSSSDQSSTGNVSNTYEKVIELTMQGKKDEAKTVVAYVNVANAILPFDDAMKETTDAIQENGFIMTNAATGTNEEDDWKVATPIKEGSLYSSPEAAAAGKIKTTIYVERLAAKVNVSLKKVSEGETVDTEAKINIVGADGETEYVLDFDAAKAVWAPTGTAPEMYKLKNQWTEELAWAEAGDNANDENGKTTRNFWAKGVYYDKDYAEFTGTPLLNYVSSNALRKTGDDTKGIKMGDSDYTTEHTYGQDVVDDPNYNALGAATSAFVLGQYVVREKKDGKPAATKFQKTIPIDGTDRSYTGYDFYLLLNTVAEKENYTIFTESELVDYLFNAQNPVLYTEQNLEKKFVASEYYTVEWKKDDKQYVLKKEQELPTTLYKTKTVAEEADPTFEVYSTVETSKGTNARHYNLGYAYFYAPIEHLAAFENEEGPLGKAVGQYGVVRNHSYKLTVNSITSLGAPLDDDHFGTDPNNPDPDPEDPGEEPIIPDPDETALIKAELKVLSWHVVSQGVDL